MIATAAQPEDTSGLLGMQSKAAWVIAGFFLLTDVVTRVAFAAGVVPLIVNLVAFAIITVAVAAELLVRGDPLPHRAAIAIAAAAPLASVLELAVAPVPLAHPSQVHLGAGVAIGGFLAARGRVGIAWAGFVAMVVVFLTWSVCTGPGMGYALGFVLPNLAVLLMALVFARTVRPLGPQILSFRAAVARVQAESRTRAVRDERKSRLEQLSEYAIPLLRVIAKGFPLRDTQKDQCRLAEAHLRDAIRAPTLGHSVVGRQAWRARQRGVTVALFDEGGLGGAAADAARRVIDDIAAAVASVPDGSVTVRIQPPGRSLLATVVADTATGQLRRAFDHTGTAVPWATS